MRKVIGGRALAIHAYPQLLALQSNRRPLAEVGAALRMPHRGVRHLIDRPLAERRAHRAGNYFWVLDQQQS